MCLLRNEGRGNGTKLQAARKVAADSAISNSNFSSDDSIRIVGWIRVLTERDAQIGFEGRTEMDRATWKMEGVSMWSIVGSTRGRGWWYTLWITENRQKECITGSDWTCTVAPSTYVVMGLTKLEQRKEGMDDERDDGTREKDKKERWGKGRNNETDSNQPVRLSSWRILFRKLSRTQESALTLGGRVG
jgi:hypothetical protein